MAAETVLTLVGNLTADPELRYTAAGAAVASFRVASTPRTMRDGKWIDGEALFLAVVCWRGLAENAAESLRKGSRVVVVGRLKQRSYEGSDGTKRTVFELEADEIAPSLRFATATVRHAQRSEAPPAVAPIPEPAAVEAAPLDVTDSAAASFAEAAARRRPARNTA